MKQLLTEILELNPKQDIFLPEKILDELAMLPPKNDSVSELSGYFSQFGFHIEDPSDEAIEVMKERMTNISDFEEFAYIRSWKLSKLAKDILSQEALDNLRKLAKNTWYALKVD